jgi:diguanylate cyclase (GGDEF)-like protein
VCPILLIAYVEIDCFALAILFLIFMNIRRRAVPYLLEQKIFMALLIANALIIIFDMLMWIIDGKPGAVARDFNYLVTACYYSMNPLICMLWYLYADFHIYKSEKHLKRMLPLMAVPACVNLALSFLSIVGDHLLFFIDENNVYRRGDLFFVMAFISFFYLLYPMILIISKQKTIQRREFVPLLVFIIPQLIGGILQSLYYGISLIWICVTLSILIIFINIQNSQLYTDYLTGLYNRRQLDNYLQQKAQNIENRPLAGIMIDLNSFKAINDEYGHQIGDQALQHTADILKKTFRKHDDFIARYGGDEFVVLISAGDRFRLPNEIERLKEKVEQFNAQNIFPFSISLSLGYDYFPADPETTAADFLKHIDGLMYQDKQRFMDASSEARPWSI